ncbi:MAG: methyltransferase domain-containing protein [Ilumatobacteraceae bacterium]
MTTLPRRADTADTADEASDGREHDGYHLGPSAAERARLLVQRDVLAPETAWLLDRLAPEVGGQVVDVGCGPLGILPELAARVGPTGRVVGLDRDRVMLSDAGHNLIARGLDEVELVVGDAMATGLPGDTFDLAHVRLLLVNVRHPETVLAELVRIVRPGGTVAVQEVDWICWQCQPPHPAWEALRNVMWRWWDLKGLDPYLGRQLPTMLRDAGLEDVASMAHTGLDVATDPYQGLLVQFARHFHDELVAADLIGAHRLDLLIESVESHLADPRTTVIRALCVQAWGRKPA